MLPKRTNEILNLSSFDLFKGLLNLGNDDALRLLLDAMIFIDPQSVKQNPIMFPNCVRESKREHPGRKKGEHSKWQNEDVVVCDNTKARLAFGKYCGLKMGGEDRNLAIGWNVAHIWGRVYDPNFFTAGWNICLLPDFLRNFVEDQSQNTELGLILQAAGWRVFKDVIPSECKRVIDDSILKLNSLPENWVPRIVGR